ncbi:response regulator [Bremerella cremea]|uniref:histidine kinase n=1 Tax=Bremerella cremea TaxID=1031537 RepID=A0A368KP04_9BACT|nr:PAS domain-containing hybrid sensor histidine kinase/response regulator [Bremerella cremea]RCS46284.1 response regulator [Bremerella cremea]
MIEFDNFNFSIAVVANNEQSERIVTKLLACGVSQDELLVVTPDCWAEATKARPSLCIWGLPANTEQDKAASLASMLPARLENSLNLRVGPYAPPEQSRYQMSWEEFDSLQAQDRLRNIIEQAHACQVYRVREHWYRMAVVEGNVGLWWWDQVLDFIYLSRHFQQMLGLSLVDLPANSQQWLEMVHPSERAGFAEAIHQQLAQDAEHFQYECRIRHQGDQYRWYSLSGQVSREEYNRPRVIGAAIDITEKKEAELRLAQANQLAQAAIRAKNEFLTNMSHNLRTPLTAVMGFAEMLNDFQPDRAASDAIQSIQENSKQLLRLLDDILELSCIESTAPTPNLCKTSIDELLRSSVEVYYLMAVQRGLAFNIEVQLETPPVLLADATRIRLILSRLIENAIKFTNQGEVSISVHYEDEPTPSLEFMVVDTGIGIPADRHDLIFEPFSQADNSTSRTHGGGGLGLSICKRNAELLGGSLSLESEVDVGTQFTLCVPVELPLTSPSLRVDTDANGQKPALPNLTGCRVLLVEDGIDNQRLIKAFLKKAGAEVVVAENGKIAVDWILAKRPVANENADDTDPEVDVILMDMQMPVMDGYQATQTLRNHNFRKPIIAVTAHALQGDRQRCLDAGCDDYYTKPITRQTLLEVVKQYSPRVPQLVT